MNASLTHTALGRRKLKGPPPVNAAKPPAAEQAATAIAHWPACGDVWVVLPPRNGESARRAHLKVSIGALVYRKSQWVAHFREVDAPQGIKPVEWFLDSQRRLRGAEDAYDLLLQQVGRGDMVGCR